MVHYFPNVIWFTDCLDVPLELLLTFNKVKAITDDVTLLAKSLCMSDMLQVSELHQLLVFLAHNV